MDVTQRHACAHRPLHAWICVDFNLGSTTATNITPVSESGRSNGKSDESKIGTQIMYRDKSLFKMPEGIDVFSLSLLDFLLLLRTSDSM